MKYNIFHLQMSIEKMRKELIDLGNNRKSFADPDVVKLSQKLDLLLDEYQELQYNPKGKLLIKGVDIALSIATSNDCESIEEYC